MHVRIADEYLTGEDLFLEGASGVTSNTKDMITLYSAYLEAFNDQTATGSDVTPDNPFVHCQTIFKGHTFMSQDTSYACGWVRTRLPAPLGAIGINATQTTMPRVHHTGPSRLCFYNQGMMPGAVSNVTLLPETDTVIAIVANASHAGDVADWASQMIIEELLEAPIRHDWERKANGVLSKITNHLPTVKRELDENQRRGTRPPYPLPRYKGSYWNDTFNLKIDINVQGDHLLMSFNGVTIPSAEKDKSMCDVAKKITYSLRHYEDNTFEWFLPHNKSVSKGRFVHLGTTESFLIRFKGTNRLLWQTGDFGSQPSVFIKKRRRTLALAP
ncbi:hypothetical protein RRF57_005956 [Xylaria bambusicola]|uniref:Beta-lactamase-related domain-containing protein n=1 Tax=Xylaria bambusicola TaxID=326684 RepID=A0AAN7UPF3_9PEZI